MRNHFPMRFSYMRYIQNFPEEKNRWRPPEFLRVYAAFYFFWLEQGSFRQPKLQGRRGRQNVIK